MTSETPIVFYDIASAKPLRTFAPNPWKTRLALNLKGIPYRTEWIDMPDIHDVREKLGVPANRTHADGTPYHTLPVIHDPSTNAIVGDTFEIALYLDKQYPDRPTLIQPSAIGLTAAFNAQIDGIFTKYVTLANQMPFDPAIAEKIGAIFAKRAGAASLKDMQITSGAQREEQMVAFEAALGELSKAYWHTGGTTDYFWKATDPKQAQRPPENRKQAGPFLDGDHPTYADCIVGAWLKMLEASMPSEDWARVRLWQGGLWARIVDGLGNLSEIK
ncbi:Hypothetical protein R9X50_00159300 [Acrodontium crateriforme]|uniref:GST N-terminal domain-containing protein n=1 Tax=Acrodontium crateriforme TaxID=150365 RepID=A0AAQ3RA71_9PEZI|nr:Hypothetical protein R9X50_00159300 [Acrodontium crateriforme]